MAPALFKMKFDLGTTSQALEITLDKGWVMFEIVRQNGDVVSASIRREYFDAFIAAYATQKDTQ